MATSTRSFGSSKREAHDASAYYARRLTQVEISDDETVNPPKMVDKCFCKSSEDMSAEVADNSVALMVTSPPYNVGKDYDDDLNLEEYLGMMMSDLGYLMRGEIIWVKGKGASGSCAWGSWKSAKNPVLRDLHEYILVFSKGRFDRVRKGENTIGRDEFMANTLSVWEFPPASAKKSGHPAPFPEELPKRLIEIYTYKGDLVLDPFCGVGTACLAAKRQERHWLGYDIDKSYIELAESRLKD